MSVLVSNTDFADIPAFVDEVKKAFTTGVPPVIISFDTKENVFSFAQYLKNEHSYLGKRVSCKHAKSSAFNNFSVAEVYSFGGERFPIQLSFKMIRDCEDFANGWIRTIEKEPVSAAAEPEPELASKPAEEPAHEKAETEKEQFGTQGTILLNQVKQKLQKGLKSSVKFETENGIKGFAYAIEQELSLEGVECEPNKTFECVKNHSTERYSIGGIAEQLPISVSFANEDDLKSFAKAIKVYFYKQKELKREKEHELKKITEKYSVNPLAEKILDNTLSTYLTLSWIIGIVVVLGGIVLGIGMVEDGLMEGLGYMCIALGIICGPLIILIGYYKWALGKVQINISRNLFNINSKLKEKE